MTTPRLFLLRIKWIVVAAIGFWFFSVAYATITIEERVFSGGRLISDVSGDRALLPFAGLFLALSGAIIGFRHRQYIFSRIKSNTAFALIGAFFLVMLFLSVAHFHIDSIAYIALFGFSMISTLYANKVLGERFFFISSIVVLAALVSFIAVHGAPTVRWIGGIHPNHVGAFALLAAFLAARSVYSARWVVYLVSMSFAIMISSRYAMIAIFIIVFSDYLSSVSKFSPRKIIGMLIVTTILFVSLIFGNEIVSQWLMLDDPQRGLDSGFTGRSGLWDYFYPQILERPFMGFGFRQRDLYQGTHNGFLNFALENGLIVTMVFFLAMLSIFKDGIARLHLRDANKRDIIVILGSWIAWAFAAFFQPQLVNFGDAFGIMTIFLLTAHVKWMVGNGTRKQTAGNSPRANAYA